MSQVSQARNLGKYFLLIDNMLVVLGFFVVFPLISIRFVDQMGWAAVMVGIALGLRQFIQQGLGIFGGAIADRFGAKPMIVTGMLMRAAGFATMGIAHEPWLLWFSCFLSGLGGTLFDLSGHAGDAAVYAGVGVYSWRALPRLVADPVFHYQPVSAQYTRYGVAYFHHHPQPV